MTNGPKPLYPVWLTESEVRCIFLIRDTYALLDSVVSKIQSAAISKGESDPINQLITEYDGRGGE